MAMTPTSARSDEAPSQRRTERRWLPVFAVIAVIAVVTAGGRSVSRAIGDVGPSSLAVTAAVTVHPAPGWTSEGLPQPAGVRTALLTRGTAMLQVSVFPVEARGPQDLLQAYLRDVLGGRYAQLTIGEAEAGTVGGVPAVRAGYLARTLDGVPIEGVVVATMTPSGAAVIFDAAAPQGDLAGVADDVVTMIESAELR